MPNAAPQLLVCCPLQDAVEANIVAHEADLLLSKSCLKAVAPEHNVAMLVYAASMAGQVTGNA